MTYSNLNMNDINELLFPQNDILINTSKSTESCEFNFTQVWGEIDTASIALNEQSSCKIEQNSLAALIGDITPAAAAVAASAESPNMATPFLDSCMGTPFTPATVFTPSLAQSFSPYYSPYIDNSYHHMNNNSYSQQDDIQVSSYLKTELPWQTPAAVTADLFANTISSTDVSPDLYPLDPSNGDPAQLLLGTIDNHIADASAEDPLFPPLPTEQPTYETPMLTTDTNHELFTTEDFEAGNFLNDCFDDTFFSMQPELQDIQQDLQQDLQQEIKLETVNNKRKNDQDTNKKNKRFKATANDDQRKFECGVCHAVFNRRYNLGTHVKVHSPTRVKDFSCHLCAKAFDRKHDLTRHVATVHNGERAYSCTKCTSTFSRKDALVRHQVHKHQQKP